MDRDSDGRGCAALWPPRSGVALIAACGRFEMACAWAGWSRIKSKPSAHLRLETKPALAYTPRMFSASTATDLYNLLGIAPDAAPDEIQRRYRFLVTALHPNRFAADPELGQQAEQLLAQLSEGYATLSDPAQRAAYDEVRRAEQELREAPARAAERELQRLRIELSRRDVELAEQKAAYGVVEQRLAEVERKAAWDKQELAGLVTAAERKAARLQAKSEAEARTNQRTRNSTYLWQAAAIVGIINTAVLLWLLWGR